MRQTLIEAGAATVIHAFDAFARRTELPKRALIILAEADCFPLARPGPPRERYGRCAACPTMTRCRCSHAQFVEELPAEADRAACRVMPLSEHVLADYQMMRLSLRAPSDAVPARSVPRRRHQELCARLRRRAMVSGARCAGIVLTRQMPGDAGVVFITLSDETGVCQCRGLAALFEKFRREVMGGRLLLIEGKVQRSARRRRASGRRADRRPHGGTGALSEGDIEPAHCHREHAPPSPQCPRIPQSRDFH